MAASSSAPLEPRKRPRQQRAEETVACIIEAAAQVLEASGRSAFNTNAVAERAGVSIGSLYQYFPGKEALLIALMQREKQRFASDAAAALDHTDGRAALDHLIQAAARQQMERAELARLIDLEEERPDARVAMGVNDTFTRVLREIAERLGFGGSAEVHRASDDLAALIRALTDAAGARGERDTAVLVQRLRGAVWGYLGLPKG